MYKCLTSWCSVETSCLTTAAISRVMHRLAAAQVPLVSLAWSGERRSFELGGRKYLHDVQLRTRPGEPDRKGGVVILVREHLVLRAWLRVLRSLLPTEQKEVTLAVLVVVVTGGRQGSLTEVVLRINVCP